MLVWNFTTPCSWLRYWFFKSSSKIAISNVADAGISGCQVWCRSAPIEETQFVEIFLHGASMGFTQLCWILCMLRFSIFWAVAFLDTACIHQENLICKDKCLRQFFGHAPTKSCHQHCVHVSICCQSVRMCSRSIYCFNFETREQIVFFHPSLPGASIPMGQGGHVPQYLDWGDIITNVPPIFLE